MTFKKFYLFMFASCFGFGGDIAQAAGVLTINSQPKSQSVVAGDQYSMQVSVSGGRSPYFYQWYKNGTKISGANAYIMYDSSAQLAEAGQYYVIVSDSANSLVKSVTANLIITTAQVQSAPAILTQPQSTSVKAGDYIYIYSRIVDSRGVIYQWYKDGIPYKGGVQTLPDGSPQYYIWIPAAAASDAGNYKVVFTNAGGSSTSSSAVVQVKSVAPTILPPAIVSQPQAQSITAGNYLYLFAKIADTKGVTFQWYKNGSPISGIADVVSDGTINYSVWISSTTTNDAGNYSVVFTNAGGSTTSATAAVSVSGVSPQPNPAPVGAMLLGGCGSCDHGGPAITYLRSLVNRTVDYTLVWGWAHTAADLMYAFHFLQDEFPTGTLHFSVPMVIHGHTFANVYSGSDDATFLDVARTIASRDPRGVIRIGHEMNGNWYDWSQDSATGTAAEYARAFQHLVKLFRQVSPNFKFVWNPGAGKWAGIDCLPTYPGDGYVDFISFDQYEDARYMGSMSPTERWNKFLVNDGRGLNWLAEFAGQHGKPIAFDEWATSIDDGTYITNMANWIRTHNVAYHMYWNSDAGFPGYLGSQPNNAAAFKREFGK